MNPYRWKAVKKILEEFPEEIKSLAATPAAEHLFEVRKDNTVDVTLKCPLFHTECSPFVERYPNYRILV